jgi:hypothetical protein
MMATITLMMASMITAMATVLSCTRVVACCCASVCLVAVLRWISHGGCACAVSRRL